MLDMTRSAFIASVLSIALVTGAARAQIRGALRVEPGARASCMPAALTSPPTEYIATRDAGGGAVELEIGVLAGPGTPRVVVGSSAGLLRVRVEMPTGTMWCTVRARLAGLASGEHDIVLEHGSQASSGLVRQHFIVR
jgi:hypothetical protein